MNDYHISNMNLKSRIISLEKTIESYRSSKKYEELRHFYNLQIKEKDVQISNLKKEMEQDSSHHKKAIREWMKANEEICEDCTGQLSSKDKEISQIQEQLNKAYQELNTLYEQVSSYKATIDSLQKQLDKEQGKNAKLNAQVNKNYENSSIPSSADSFRKKIENGRKPSGKKQGGQKGHQGHSRKRYEATNIIQIQTPEEYLDTSKYVATGKIIKKQVVNLSLVVQVDEYQVAEYRCIANRHKVHAPFPEGINNEVNYGASVQALAFLLNNHYNVSIAKTSDFLYEVSGCTFRISTGCINQLTKTFTKKTKEQQAGIYDSLVKAPVLHTDFTTAPVSGKLKQVLICASKEQMMFFARDHKGHKGIEGSPVAHSTNILLHDHEIAFYKYGTNHQECLVHVLRYLKGSIENEKNLSWNKRMYETVHKMMHYVNDQDVCDEKEIQAIIKEYDINLEIAELNYKEHPPSKYYREGYNLYKRMKVFRDNHILFLEKEGVPYDNNLSERLARVIKRKVKQMTTFRSFGSFADTCTSLGVLETIRLEGGNLLKKVEQIFE